MFSKPRDKTLLPSGTSISHLSGILASAPGDLLKASTHHNKHSYLHPCFGDLANVPLGCGGECFAPYLLEAICFCAAAQKISFKSDQKSLEKASGSQKNDFQKFLKIFDLLNLKIKISLRVFHCVFKAWSPNNITIRYFNISSLRDFGIGSW